MNYKILVPMFVFGLFFSACSKKTDSNNNTTENPILSSYQQSDMLLIDQVAIYTSTGVVTDPSTIQSYINHHLSATDAQKFYVGQSYVGNPFGTLRLDFLTENRVQLYGKIMEITGTNDSLMLVSEYDQSNVPPSPVSACDKLKANVPLETPLSNCTTDSCTQYRKTYPIRIFGNTFYLPFLYYAVSHSEPGAECSSVASEFPMQNVLNSYMPSSLGQYDSVLVQIGRLPMTRRY